MSGFIAGNIILIYLALSKKQKAEIKTFFIKKFIERPEENDS